MQIVLGLGVDIGNDRGVELKSAAIRSGSGAAIGILPDLSRRAAARIVDDAVARSRRGRRLSRPGIGLACRRGRHGNAHDDGGT